MAKLVGPDHQTREIGFTYLTYQSPWYVEILDPSQWAQVPGDLGAIKNRLDYVFNNNTFTSHQAALRGSLGEVPSYYAGPMPANDISRLCLALAAAARFQRYLDLHPEAAYPQSTPTPSGSPSPGTSQPTLSSASEIPNDSPLEPDEIVPQAVIAVATFVETGQSLPLTSWSDVESLRGRADVNVSAIEAVQLKASGEVRSIRIRFDYYTYRHTYRVIMPDGMAWQDPGPFSISANDWQEFVSGNAFSPSRSVQGGPLAALPALIVIVVVGLGFLVWAGYKAVEIQRQNRGQLDGPLAVTPDPSASPAMFPVFDANKIFGDAINNDILPGDIVSTSAIPAGVPWTVEVVTRSGSGSPEIFWSELDRYSPIPPGIYSVLAAHTGNPAVDATMKIGFLAPYSSQEFTSLDCSDKVTTMSIGSASVPVGFYTCSNRNDGFVSYWVHY